MSDALTMPALNIVFRARANGAVARSQKGVVALLVRDATANEDEKAYALASAAQIPEALGVENQDAIRRVFAGNVDRPRKVLVYVMAATGTVTAGCPALLWLATQQFDYLAGHDELSAEEAAVIKDWVIKQRSDHHAIYKAVLPNQAADNEAIVNFTATDIKSNGKVYTTAAWCGRIAGMLAGTPLTQSATYAVLPDVQDIKRLDAGDEDTAVGAGKLILTHDGEKVKIGRAVTSLTTVAAPKTAAWKKIKIIETLDMVGHDLRLSIQDAYIGKHSNLYDDKLALLVAIREYLRGLAQGKLIEADFTADIDVEAQRAWLEREHVPTADMTEEAIRKANTGSHVFLVLHITPVDAMEDITVAIVI